MAPSTEESPPWSVENASWSPATGEGRSRLERAVDKPALVYLALLNGASADPAWQSFVAQVRNGKDPLEVARASRYGHGGRRTRVIASALVHSAFRGPAFAYSVVAEAAPEYAGNRYSRSFWAKVERGVDCILRIGGGRCLDCDAVLPVSRRESGGEANRTARAPYCSNGDLRPLDRDAISFVFVQAAAALRIRLDTDRE